MVHWKVSGRVALAATSALVVLVVVACQPPAAATGSVAPPTSSPVPDEEVPASAPTEALEDAQLTPVPTAPVGDPTPGISGVDGALALAQSDLAKRLGVAQEEIVVRSFEAVQWSDASLGCPQPRMMYAQVITPGFRVVLEMEEKVYEYHTDAGQSLVLCEENVMDSAQTGPGAVEPGSEELVNQAREDLAQRLSVPPDQIEVLEVRSVVWPDASLGCPQPGMGYAQVPQEGLLIRLSVDREMYFYHSGGAQAPFLCEVTSQVIPKSTPKVDEFVPPPDSEIDRSQDRP